jgi:hypothetical protein
MMMIKYGSLIAVSGNLRLLVVCLYVCLFIWRDSPPVDHGLIHVASRSHSTTHPVVRTPLDEWSARRRDLYLTTQHNRQTFMPPVGFESTVSAGELPQTYALDRAATGTGTYAYLILVINQLNAQILVL